MTATFRVDNANRKEPMAWLLLVVYTHCPKTQLSPRLCPNCGFASQSLTSTLVPQASSVLVSARRDNRGEIMWNSLTNSRTLQCQKTKKKERKTVKSKLVNSFYPLLYMRSHQCNLSGAESLSAYFFFTSEQFCSLWLHSIMQSANKEPWNPDKVPKVWTWPWTL